MFTNNVIQFLQCSPMLCSELFRGVQNCAAVTEHRVTRQRAQHSLANELRPIFHLWRLDFLAVKQVSFHTESESGTQRAGLQDYVGSPIQPICFKLYSLFMILCQFKFVKLRVRPCFQYFCLDIKTQIRHSKHQCNESLTMMRLQEIYLNKDKKNSPPSILCRHTMPRSVFLLPTWDYNGWSVTDGWGGDQIAQNYPLRWGEPAWQVWVGKKPLEAKKTRKFQTLYTFQIKSRSLMFCLTQWNGTLPTRGNRSR